MKKYSEKLRERYESEIEAWDWDYISNCVYASPCWDETGEPDGVVFSHFLGSVFSLMPSGKYYTSWTSNQTVRDMIMDQAFSEALEAVAESHGFVIESGDGNPSDLFVCTWSNDDIFYQDKDSAFFHLDEKIAETDEELEEWMNENNYYPNIFRVSDHGNLSLYEIEESS